MFSRNKIRSLIEFEEPSSEFQDSIKKCAVIHSINGFSYEDLVDVLFRDFQECFYAPGFNVYFLLKIGEEGQSLYSYEMIFNMCINNTLGLQK